MTKLNLLQGLIIFFCIATLVFVVAFAWTGGLAYMLTAITSFSAAGMAVLAYDHAFLRKHPGGRIIENVSA